MSYHNCVVVLFSLLFIQQAEAQETTPTAPKPPAKAPARPKPAAGSTPGAPPAKTTPAAKPKAGAAPAAKPKTTTPAARPKAQTPGKAKPAPKKPATSPDKEGLPADDGDTNSANDSAKPSESPPPAVAKPIDKPVLSTEALQEQFRERVSSWRAAQLQIESTAAQARIVKGEEQKAAVNLLAQQSREAAVSLAQAVEPALVLFERDPQEAEVREFLIQAVGIFGRRGRLEEAATIANKLISHDCRDVYVNVIATLAALEAFDIASAQKYYAVVREQDASSKLVDVVFDKLDANRELFERERDVRSKEAAADDLPRVLLVTTQGEIEIELFEDDYPNAVANYLKLVDSHFYDRLPFCQVTPGFGAIGGCLYADGTGGPGFEIPAQASVEFPRMPMRGAVSLVNMGDGACSSKFLISYSWPTSARLRGAQPVIGRVIRGMDVASELNWIEPREDRVFNYDGILSARILRKRPHEYVVVTTQNLAADKFNAGVELLNTGKAADAEAPLLEALKIAPRDRLILDAIALALSQQERLNDAVTYLQRGVDVDPHSPDAHHHLGKVLGALERLDDAREHYQTAIKLKPDYVDARLDLGDLLRKEGKYGAAVEQYAECLKYTPDAAFIQQRLRDAVSETDAQKKAAEEKKAAEDMKAAEEKKVAKEE